MFCGISHFLISIISRHSSANSSVHPYSLSDVLSVLLVTIYSVFCSHDLHTVQTQRKTPRVYGSFCPSHPMTVPSFWYIVYFLWQNASKLYRFSRWSSWNKSIQRCVKCCLKYPQNLSILWLWTDLPTIQQGCLLPMCSCSTVWTFKIKEFSVPPSVRTIFGIP